MQEMEMINFAIKIISHDEVQLMESYSHLVNLSETYFWQSVSFSNLF